MPALTREDIEAAERQQGEKVDAIVQSELVTAPIEDLELVEQTTAIETATVYTRIGHVWRVLGDEIQRRKDYFSERKARAHRVWKDWCDAEHESIDALVEAQSKAGKLIGAYDAEQRQKAEDENERKQREAEERERDRQFLLAAEAREAGDEDAANEILAEPVMVAPVDAVAPATPKVSGLATAGRAKAEVVDLDKLILAAAEEIKAKRSFSRTARTLLTVDKVALNRSARNLSALPKAALVKMGVSVWEDRSPRRSRRRIRRPLR